MTPRAYSSFIAKVCAPRAASQQAGASVTFRLLRELVLKGSPTLLLLLMFAAYSLLTYKTRRGLANWVSAFKQRVTVLTSPTPRPRFRSGSSNASDNGQDEPFHSLSKTQPLSLAEHATPAKF